MKSLHQTLLLVTTVLSLLLPAAVASDRWDTLRAINQVENPTNQTHYGPKGELGPYQFRRDTWRQYTRRPFTLATDRAAADEVAVHHYERIRHELSAAGIDPTVFNIAMAWNCGINAVLAGRIPTVTYRYATQVGNLVESYERAATAAAVATMPVVRTLPVPPASEYAVSFRPEVPAVPKYLLTPGAPQFMVDGQLPLFVVARPAPQLAEAGVNRAALTF
ncbi:MAG: hypothetical protein ACHQ5A_04040 [Opitutales bacterium]